MHLSDTAATAAMDDVPSVHASPPGSNVAHASAGNSSTGQ